MDETMGNPQETQKPTEAEIGWLAGIIDGEGSIAMAIADNGKKLNLAPRIEVANTDKEIIEKVVRIVKSLGCGIYVWQKSEGNASKLVKERTGFGFKTIHIAKVCGFNGTDRLLPHIIPHLTGEKLHRAKLLQRFVDSRIRRTNGLNVGRRYLYDAEDYRVAIEFAKTMRTRFLPTLEGLLRDCTGAQQKAA